MASVTMPIRNLGSCTRCVRQLPTANGAPRRFFASTATNQEELQSQSSTPPPPAPPASNTSSLDSISENKSQTLKPAGANRTLVGSRRRRAAISRLPKKAEIPFEQLPYQCFQEARKFLLEDRQQKIKEIEVQQMRIKNLEAQDAVVSGSVLAKENRLRSMKKHLDDLIILADINDPIVKRKFEDGQGDMNKPIYRYLADEKWRKYKRLVLEQRITQLGVVPDFLPAFNLVADVDLGFGRRDIGPGEFVDSSVSESMPRLSVQTFTPGEKLVTVVFVDGDVPAPEKDGFSYRCHLIASNITISPTLTSIPLQRIAQEDAKQEDAAAKKIIVPWQAPWAHKGAPYHRLAIFILEQNSKTTLDVAKISKTAREDFNLRSFVDSHKMTPLGATLFRTQWDEGMAGVMERTGLQDQINVEFKRKRIEPLPYKRRTERMR